MSSSYRVTIEPVSPGTQASVGNLRYNDPNLVTLPPGLREFVLKQANPSNDVLIPVRIIQKVMALYEAEQNLTGIDGAVTTLFGTTNSLSISGIAPAFSDHLSPVVSTITGTGFDLMGGITVSVGGFNCAVTILSATSAEVLVPPLGSILADQDVVVSYTAVGLSSAKTLAGAFDWT